MRKRVTVLGVLAVAVAAGAWVHRVSAGKEAKAADAAAFDAAERAMAKLKIDDPVGFNDVLTAAGLPHNKASFDQLKAFREGAVERIGKPLGQVELVGKERVGTSFVKFVYLERYERTALVWSLTFYRDADGWKAVQIDWGGDVRPLFQKAG
jgi:hypothetical protein